MPKEYSRLSSYLSDPTIYSAEFDSAEKESLFDYQGLLIWKTFIHFCYEKIQQVRRIVGEEKFFNEFWNHDVTSDSKKFPLTKFDAENLYSYSDIEDEHIIRLMVRIFQLEKNCLDSLATAKKKRDFASHVVRKSLFSLKDSEVLDMLGVITGICGLVDEKYKNKYLASIDDAGMAGVNLSSSEINYYIGKKIEALSRSRSFDSSQDLMEILEKNLDKLSVKSIDSILTTIQNGKIIHGYNQALDLGYSASFLINLLGRSKQISADLEPWKAFYLGLGESDQKRFIEIRRSLENAGIEFDFKELKYIDPLDLPF